MVNEINGRSLAGVINELKDEIKEFLQTRFQMLRSEMQEKLSSIKTAAPLLAAAVLFLLTAFLLFTLFLVSIIAVAFEGNPYAYALAFAIVTVFWSIVGGICAWLGVRELSAQGLAPKRTIKVLQDDKIWIQGEARSQL